MFYRDFHDDINEVGVDLTYRRCGVSDSIITFIEVQMRIRGISPLEKSNVRVRMINVCDYQLEMGE